MTMTITQNDQQVAVANTEHTTDVAYLAYKDMLKDLAPLKAICLFDGSETIFKVLNDLGYIDTMFSADSATVYYVPKRRFLVSPPIMEFDGSESDEEKSVEDSRLDCEFADNLTHSGWDAKIADMMCELDAKADAETAQVAIASAEAVLI